MQTQVKYGLAPISRVAYDVYVRLKTLQFLTLKSARTILQSALNMAASKTEDKRDWALINNVLQWTFLISTVVYLVVEKTGSIKMTGEPDVTLKRYEALLKKNEHEQGKSLPDKLADKETCLKRFEGRTS